MDEQRLRRAVTVLGAVNDPNAEAAIEFAKRARWWQVCWYTITHPRSFWLGFVDGFRNA